MISKSKAAAGKQRVGMGHEQAEVDDRETLDKPG